LGARLRMLDSGDCEAIDEASRSLLFHAGVDVHSERARSALAEVGAMVDSNSIRVRFSDAVLKEALRSAPKEVLFASRDGKHDVRVPDGRTHVTTDGAGVNVLDLDTDERRPSTRKDLADLTRVADALDAVDVLWPMVVAGDAPQRIHVLVEAATAFEHTSKNVQHETLSREEAEALVAMAGAIVGGPEELRRRPIISSVQCPVSPLVLEGGSTEGLMVLARAGVPVLPISMVLMGGSSPVDLASALVLAGAENLASLCVAQAVAPGAPVIWSVCSGPIDMRVGSFASGSPEASLLSVAGVEMARHYRLPCLVGGFACDADSPGTQAGAEKLASGLLAMLAGADLLSGIGGVETDSCLSLEQLVIDADLVDYARRVLDPFLVSPETIHLDLLTRLGPGGNYLKERHTLTRFRDAIWSPRLFLRDGYMEDRGHAEPRLRAKAKARAAELLKGHEPAALDDDARAEIWRIVEKARAG